jgi:F-box-like
MKPIKSIQVPNSNINLRPTKRRTQEKVEFTLNRVPKDIWLMIFNYLVPKRNDFRRQESINSLYNCRFVCKKWADIASNDRLWNQIIYLAENCIGLWEDLTHYKRIYDYESRKFIKPCSFFAQITMRNFKKEDATMTLLSKWFRTKRWRLLFQTLSPILTLSTTNFDNNNPNSHWNEFFINFEKNMHSQLFRYGPDIHNIEHYVYKMKKFWSNNEYGVKRYYGDCFSIQDTSVRDRREPYHLVFHNDERGPYLEIRRWMEGSGLNCYSSDRVDPKHIWFGILCMQELWKGYNILNNYPRVQEEWRKCMTIQPKMI